MIYHLRQDFIFILLGLGIIFMPVVSIAHYHDGIISSDAKFIPPTKLPTNNMAFDQIGSVVGDHLLQYMLGPINEWANQPVKKDGNAYDVMLHGLQSLNRNLIANTASQILNQAKYNILNGGGNNFTIDKVSLAKIALNGVAQTSEEILNQSDIAALANIEIKAGIGLRKKPKYSISTIFPLFKDKTGRHNILMQTSAGRVFKMGRGRTTINAGLAYRYLSNNNKWIYEVNSFYDHEFPYNHRRTSIGLAAKSSLFRANMNYYKALSGSIETNKTREERPVNGFDLELGGRLSKLPKLELSIRGTKWNGVNGNENIKEFSTKAIYSPVPAVSIEIEGRDDNISKPNYALAVGFKYIFGSNFKEQFEPASSAQLLNIKPRLFNKVNRQNGIKIIKYDIKVLSSNAANPQTVPTVTVPTISVAPPMVKVLSLGKSFTMGCSKLSNVFPYCPSMAIYSPARNITFGHNFEIGKYEVTWNDYLKCVVDGGCGYPVDYNNGSKGKYPISGLSVDVIENKYIEWLNKKTGLNYRLPSDAEWEYVAGAGTGNSVPWGGTKFAGNNNANCANATVGGHVGCGDIYTKTAPVGSFTGYWGVHDMIGNVMEWVADNYTENSSLYPTNGTAYTGGMGNYFVRGGSYDSHANLNNIYWRATTSFTSNIGFRLARTL